MSIFDGLAGVLDGVFGSPVTWTPAGGVATEVQGVFREPQAEFGTEDGGSVLVNPPEIKIRRPQADGITTDDLIAPGNGKTYRVAAAHPSGSPASDAFVTFSLEALS